MQQEKTFLALLTVWGVALTHSPSWSRYAYHTLITLYQTWSVRCLLNCTMNLTESVRLVGGSSPSKKDEHWCMANMHINTCLQGRSFPWQNKSGITLTHSQSADPCSSSTPGLKLACSIYSLSLQIGSISFSYPLLQIAFATPSLSAPQNLISVNLQHKCLGIRQAKENFREFSPCRFLKLYIMRGMSSWLCPISRIDDSMTLYAAAGKSKSQV